jgi:hypothetical protein
MNCDKYGEWDGLYCAREDDLKSWYGAKFNRPHLKTARKTNSAWIEGLRFVGDNGSDQLKLSVEKIMKELYSSSGCHYMLFKDCYFEDVTLEGLSHHNVTFVGCRFLRTCFEKGRYLPYHAHKREFTQDYEKRRSQLYMTSCMLEGCKIEDFCFINLNNCNLSSTDIRCPKTFRGEISCCWVVNSTFDVMLPSFEYGDGESDQRPPLRFWDTHLTHSKIYLQDINLTEHKTSVNDMFKGSTDLYKTELREYPIGGIQIMRDGLIVAGGQEVVPENCLHCENSDDPSDGLPGRLHLEYEESKEDLFPIKKEDNLKFYEGIWKNVQDMTKSFCDPNKLSKNMLYKVCSESAFKKGYFNERDIQTDNGAGGNCGTRYCDSLSDCVYGIKRHQEGDDNDE